MNQRHTVYLDRKGALDSVTVTLVGLQTSETYLGRPSKGSVKLVPFDQEYVRLLTEQDPETERHFVSYFSELIRIKLRSKLRSHQLIEEVRQETFLRVLNTIRRGGLQSAERLGAFVNTVCNNVMMEAIRAESKTRPFPEEGFDTPDTRADAESELVTEERKRMVKTVLAGLPPKQRDLLRMVFLEEKDKEEVCRLMSVDREYLRVLIHRAKECFRASFTNAWQVQPGSSRMSGANASPAGRSHKMKKEQGGV